MLRLFQGIMNGPKVADLPERSDLTWIEGFAVAPLVIGFVLLGIDPAPVAGLAADAARVLTGASAAQAPLPRGLQPRQTAVERTNVAASSIR
jgi:NADH:ubiquinone oxidoreductase subunit 4 (subunit M)